MSRPRILMIAQEEDHALATAPIAVVPRRADDGAPADPHGNLIGDQAGLPPAQDLQFQLRAAFDQLPEPQVRKMPRAWRLGLLILPPVGLWLGISWLIRALG